MWFQIPMNVNWISVFQFRNPTTIKTHITFRIITHLIGFWFFIKIWIEMSFTHFALFTIFIEHQFRRVFKQNFVCSFLAITMHCTSNLLGRRRKKWTQQLKGEKIPIHFIKLGIRPTSTLGPKRDQLVDKML